MRRRIKLFLQNLVARMPFEVRWRLPVVTLEPLNLVLAGYEARGKAITVVQVGACDGINNDPIRHLVTKGNSRAILIEPNPFAFARLQKSYADVPNVTLIQAAIGHQDGEAHLYRIKTTDPRDSAVDLTLQIASFYREHLERHGKKAHEIERITVPCRTLGSLTTELGLAKIDLLQIDAEGFDAAVVRMALGMPVRPECINFEHIHLQAADRQPLFDLLQAHDYLLGYDAWNVLALQKSALEKWQNQKRA